MAYAEVEPFGETRADLRAGIVASTIHNCHITKRSDARSPADFMPKFGESNTTARKPIESESAWKAFKAKLSGGAVTNSQIRERVRKRKEEAQAAAEHQRLMDTSPRH